MTYKKKKNFRLEFSCFNFLRILKKKKRLKINERERIIMEGLMIENNDNF